MVALLVKFQLLQMAEVLFPEVPEMEIRPTLLRVLLFRDYLGTTPLLHPKKAKRRRVLTDTLAKTEGIPQGVHLRTEIMDLLPPENLGQPIELMVTPPLDVQTPQVEVMDILLHREVEVMAVPLQEVLAPQIEDTLALLTKAVAIHQQDARVLLPAVEVDTHHRQAEVAVLPQRVPVLQVKVVVRLQEVQALQAEAVGVLQEAQALQVVLTEEDKPVGFNVLIVAAMQRLKIIS